MPAKQFGLLERADELAVIEASVAAARDGSGGLLLVEGPAGIGKTGLIQAAGELAAAQSMRVLAARGGELECDYAYGVVRQLFLESSTVIDRAGRLGDDPAGALLHALYWLTANEAARQPLALIVDDLHWADEASLRFLVYLVRRLASMPVLVVAGTRAHPAPDFIINLKAEPLTKVLWPRELSQAGVTTLIRGEFDESAADGFCRSCAEATGGNPFLLRELLSTLREQGRNDLTGLVPTSLGETILVRLGRLPAPAGAVARAIAVLGTEVPPRHACTLAGLDPDAGAAACDQLAAVGILRPGRPLDFTHPLVRAAVHESIPAAERSRLHRAAARLLDEEGADALRIAPHLLACDGYADGWVVRTLRTAATGAVGRGAAELAVRYLERALAEPPTPAVRPLVLAELGKAEVRTAEPASGVAHLRAAFAAGLPARERAELAHDLAIGLVAPGHYRDAVEMLAEAAAAAAQVDPELALRLRAELICAARLDPATLPIAREHAATITPPEGTTPGERMLLATLAHWRMIRGCPAAEAAEMVTRAIDRGLLTEQPGDSGVVIDALVTLVVAEDFARARQAFETAFADVRARGSVIGYARLCCMRAMLAYRQGFLAEAEADAESAIETATPAGYRVAGMAHGPLLDALIPQGRLAEAQAALVAGGLAGVVPDTYMHNYVLASRGRLRLADGDVVAALNDLTELDRREAKWRAPNPAVLGYGFDLARAHAAAGDVDAATVIADRELAAAVAWGTPAAIGAAQRALGLLSGDVDLLAASVSTLESSGARLELARSLVDLGAALRRTGHRGAAREPLAAGMDLAHQCGAVLLVEQARQEALAAGSRPRRIARTGLDALTASERRVARMAAAGLTNRDIAQALFVTVRTVQVHLQHAFDKLGIDSRTKLPAIDDEQT